MPHWRRAVLLGVTALVAVGAAAYWSAGEWAAADHRRVGQPPPDLPAQAVDFRAADGDTLRGWFVPGEPGGGAVLLMHGSHETRRAMIGRARFLHRHGYTVLLFDFHAYGESSGTRTTFGYGEAADAAAAVALLRTLAPGERVAAIGFSLGGAAALLGEQPLAVDALIVEAVYADIRDAVANRLRLRFGPLGPWLAPLLTAQVGWRFGLRLDQLRPVEGMKRVRVPVLIIAGAADGRAPPADAQRLFAAAHEPKRLWIVPGAAHVNFQHFAPGEYEAHVLAFLDRYLRGSAAP
ncbi:alpha/beta hydrolase [bacterium]|nr:alpha/beta hydrolase [bacterium]